MPLFPPGSIFDQIPIEDARRPFPCALVRDLSSGIQYERDFNKHRLIVIGGFSPEFGNIAFAGVTRVIPVGGNGPHG